MGERERERERARERERERETARERERDRDTRELGRSASILASVGSSLPSISRLSLLVFPIVVAIVFVHGSLVAIRVMSVASIVQ